MGPARIYLTGHLAIECGSTIVDERHLAGRQGRVAFAYLLTHRAAPVSRDELLEVIWRDAPPPEVETAMSAILSRLRSALKKAHLPDAGIDLRMGVARQAARGHTDRSGRSGKCHRYGRGMLAPE